MLIDTRTQRVLDAMRPNRVYSIEDLDRMSLDLGTYSPKRVIMYLLFDGRVIRVGDNRFVRALARP